MDAIVHLLKPVQAHALTITSDIREYFPKKTEFKHITDEQIVEVQNRLNARLRKILNYKTPAEVFFDTITKSYAAV